MFQATFFQFHKHPVYLNFQMFSLTHDGVLRRETTCVDIADPVKFVGNENKLQLAECDDQHTLANFERTKVIQ